MLYLIDLTRKYKLEKTWNCGLANMELILVKLEISVLLDLNVNHLNQRQVELTWAHFTPFEL